MTIPARPLSNNQNSAELNGPIIGESLTNADSAFSPAGPPPSPLGLDPSVESPFELASEFNLELDPELLLAQLLEDPSLTQHLVRHRFETEETLVTYLRCEIAANLQRYILHVPFYPHFQAIPQVRASLFDDTSARVRVTDQQKFGARIEITLDHPASSDSQVMLEVSASAAISPKYSE